MRGLNSPTMITEKWGGSLWTRRRILMLVGGLTATMLLLLHIATITYEYEIPKSPFRSASKTESKRVLLKDLLDPSHTILRPFDHATFHFGKRYTYIKNLGNGYEGAARVYKDSVTGQDVIIKSWFKSTRQEPVPAAIAARLMKEHKITVADWPVEIPATLHDYDSPHFSPNYNYISYAIDAFYTATPDDSPEFGWRIVLPLWSHGTVDQAVQAISYLNLTIEDIDWLYRPRFRRVWQMLTKLNTAAVPEMGIPGYCHDDVKLDNIFHADEAGNLILADMGQVRPFDDPFHSDWVDCRLVDAQKAWRSYMALLRWSQDRTVPKSERFEERFLKKEEEWAKAHFHWYDTKYTPLDTLANDPFWRNMQSIWKRSSITMPVFKDGQIVNVTMGRDQAFVEIEKVRKEMMRVRKEIEEEKQDIVYPWWWWNLPMPEESFEVDEELEVFWGRATLVGASESYRNGKYPDEWAKIKADQKAEEEARQKLQDAVDATAAAQQSTPPPSVQVEPSKIEPPAESVQLAREESSTGDPNVVQN